MLNTLEKVPVTRRSGPRALPTNGANGVVWRQVVRPRQRHGFPDSDEAR